MSLNKKGLLENIGMKLMLELEDNPRLNNPGFPFLGRFHHSGYKRGRTYVHDKFDCVCRLE